jgi:transposase
MVMTQLPIEQLTPLQQTILDVVRMHKYPGQISCSGLAKSMHDMGFGELLRQLGYKAT